MKVIQTRIPGLLVLEPKVFGDARGFFMETFNEREFNAATGVQAHFVQDNHSRSARGVLRGLHYQAEQAQGKLVRVARGEVFDVAVDLRPDSATRGQWVGAVLSEENNRQFWIPAGFAHGFFVRSEFADFLYKTSDYYAPQHERCIRWDDPQLAIDWPIGDIPIILSPKDAAGQSLSEALAG